MSGPKKSIPKAPGTSTIKGKGKLQGNDQKAQDVANDPKAWKDLLESSGLGKDKLLEIFSDPKQLEKMLPLIFANINSISKLFTTERLSQPAKNTLLGLPGGGLAGGYGGHPIEGYIQFNPSSYKPEQFNKLPAPKDPTEKPGRVEKSSNNKFIKVSQNNDPNLALLEKYKEPDSIANAFVNKIKRQLDQNPYDQEAVSRIVKSYQQVYVNDLNKFFADTDSGQEILSKITPKR